MLILELRKKRNYSNAFFYETADSVRKPLSEGYTSIIGKVGRDGRNHPKTGYR
ncbi:hypothetical protein [Candidatus Nitrosocosmicus arcticus]|uniref:Uncharacterized protein n=1 Tax=Candidatus Nitrosocosmicus arcticus TaxID=2035267 RepID=A0A557STZ8_9ARCH|nr:hypothetical protein [Candidatus Nitrosocosmicus arcticus]TVP40094.1 hypothetical protein NARC_100157 [Candidatus Nitrosocosmicus arcticus]